MEKAIIILLKAMFENRIALLLSLALSAAGFGWCLYAPDWTRYAAATTFTLLVYIPLVKPVRPQAPIKETEE